MVGSSGIRDRQGRGWKISLSGSRFRFGHRGRSEQLSEWSKPGAENRSDVFVPLQVNSANLSSAVIEVEVSGKFRFAAHALRKVIRNVCSRTQQSLFLTAPQSDSNGASRLQTERLEDANSFHAYGRTGCVVRGSGAAVPGIKMRSEHDDLILQ